MWGSNNFEMRVSPLFFKLFSICKKQLSFGYFSLVVFSELYDCGHQETSNVVNQH